MTNPTYFHHLGKSWSLDDRDYNLIFSTGRVFIQIFKYDKTYIVRYCFTNFRRWRGGGNYMYVSEARIQQKVRLRRKKERRADSQIGSGNRTVFFFFFLEKNQIYLSKRKTGICSKNSINFFYLFFLSFALWYTAFTGPNRTVWNTGADCFRTWCKSI